MFQMGQTFFSREIMQRFNSQKVHTVAVRGRGDFEMEAISTLHGKEVWVCPDPSCSPSRAEGKPVAMILVPVNQIPSSD